MSHVFISYNKKHNREYARKLADKLLEHGFDVWIDDKIDYGDDWWPVITKAIRDCKAFVPIMTPESDVSEWVRREVHLANQLPRPIFPILLAGNLIDCDFWTMFLGKQHADVRTGDLPKEDFYTRLEREAPRKATRGIEVNAPVTPPPTLRPAGILPDDLFYTMMMFPPPFEWIEIPGGEVILEDASSRDGTKGGVYNIPSFIISKYPITNAQFQVFVNHDNGYRKILAGGIFQDVARAWREENPKPGETALSGEDLPRTNVIWYEAVAYCRWLSATNVGKVQFTLPTEQQWQRAAIGDTGWLYPWGDKFDTSKCNTADNNIGRPTPVTQYPQGASPSGVMDMSGNVSEWCLTIWGDDSVTLSGDNQRCLRGGNWGFRSIGTDCARASYREHYILTDKLNFIGFRIVVSSIRR